MSYTLETNAYYLFDAGYPETSVRTAFDKTVNAKKRSDRRRYFLRATVDVTQNKEKKQFTVTVKDVCSYFGGITSPGDGPTEYTIGSYDGSYTYQFQQNISVGIATNSDDCVNTNTINAIGTKVTNGGRYWSGWLPVNNMSSGIPTAISPLSINYSKTFNYNSNGSAPDVYIYLRANNNNVKYLSTGTWDPGFCYTSSKSNYLPSGINITAKNWIPKLDLAKPNITVTKTATTYNKCEATISSDIACDLYEYKWDTESEKTSSSITLSKAVEGGTHKLTVKGRRKGTDIWSTGKSVDFDCRKPSINGFSIRPSYPDKDHKPKFSYTLTSGWKTSDMCLKYWVDSNYTSSNSKIDNTTTNINIVNKDLPSLESYSGYGKNKLGESNSYTYTVKRIENSKIIDSLVNTKSTTIDLIYPTMGFSDVTFTGEENKLEANIPVTINNVKSSQDVLINDMEKFNGASIGILTVNDLTKIPSTLDSSIPRTRILVTPKEDALINQTYEIVPFFKVNNNGEISNLTCHYYDSTGNKITNTTILNNVCTIKDITINNSTINKFNLYNSSTNRTLNIILSNIDINSDVKLQVVTTRYNNLKGSAYFVNGSLSTSAILVDTNSKTISIPSYVYINGQKALPYIYHNGEWVLTTPYVYSKGKFNICK